MTHDDLLWTAMRTRDARWDAAFVYAVTSTRIYCRPTCPSRRPARDRVRFFPAPQAAEAEGFRACRRCRPQLARTLPPHIERVRRACESIASSGGEHVSLLDLARQVGGNPEHLARTFKDALGVSPREYADAWRMRRLREQLREGRDVTTATYEAGYGSSSRVYERAPSMLGMTPATYARGAKGEIVRYAVVASALGRLLVAATLRGVCAVKLGSSDAALVTDLRHEYPSAQLDPADPALAGYLEEILTSLAPGAPDPRLPLDVRATAFQRRVWQELQRIPRGETRSYRQVAEAVGVRSGARSVARACASNPVAILVPCHRVVRSDGAMGGYHWGAARKRKLLEVERKTIE